MAVCREKVEDAPPYPNAHAHLLDELRWLNRLIAAHVLRLRQVNFYEGLKNFRGFFVADDEIDALLAAEIFEADGKVDDEARAGLIAKLLSQAEDIRREIARRVRCSMDENVLLPLEHLRQSFCLSEFELKTLLICLAPEIDTRFGRLYGALQEQGFSTQPTIEFILDLLCTNAQEKLYARRYFFSSSPLLAMELIRLGEGASFGKGGELQRHANLAPHILEFLLGANQVDNRLDSLVEVITSREDWNEMYMEEEVKKQLVSATVWIASMTADNSKEMSHCPILYLKGASGSGRQKAAAILCNNLGLRLLRVHLDRLMHVSDSFEETIGLILREAKLQKVGVLWDYFDELLDTERLHWLRMFCAKLKTQDVFHFLAGERLWEPQGLFGQKPFLRIDFLYPSFKLRKQIWQDMLNAHDSIFKAEEIDDLAEKFHFTPGQIKNAVISSKSLVALHAVNNGKMTLKDLYVGCRAQSNQKLAELAQRIDPKYTWDDLVLPKEQTELLQDIVKCVRCRHIVYEECQFDKSNLGKGICVLFSGPSGTGKTMAAEVIADDLKLDLYKIDLSRVVSKWVGETEKNLSRVFKEAETSNAILFFDEADTLFSKRLQVRDTHDHYTNLEVGFLLQKIEEYNGISLLSTNKRQSLDNAFVRRFKFIIEFPMPESDCRARIWRKALNGTAPISEGINFDTLASKIEISGGNIHNICEQAVFLAVTDKQIVRAAHIRVAIDRELRKIGKMESINLDLF